MTEYKVKSNCWNCGKEVMVSCIDHHIVCGSNLCEDCAKELLTQPDFTNHDGGKDG